MDVLIGVLVAIPTVLFTIKFKALKISAAVLAGILITIISYCGGISAVLILIGAYFSVILLEKILKKSSRLTEDINKKQGARDFIQVFVNGISAVLFIILFKITANHIFFLTYIVGIIEALADSVASDVGILSKKPPRDICTLKTIPAGMSGGVTFLGFASSLICCSVMATIIGILLKIDFRYILIVSFVAFLGCVIDSILGSAIQAKYRCSVCNKHTEKLTHCEKETLLIGGYKLIDNCAVNLISNFVTCIIASLIMMI